MPIEQLAEAIQTGGVILLLVAAVLGFYRGYIITKPTHDAIVQFWHDRWTQERKENVEWQAQAKSVVASLDRLSDAIEVRNRIDERGP